MKVLYVTTVGLTMGFFKSFIRQLLDEGHTVDIATNEREFKIAEYYREWGCTVYPLSCSRSPLKPGNVKAIKEIKKIVKERNYDIVHCHTPIAAACTRLACRGLRKKGVKVVYTAHGFHFYNGAPLKNWLIYYPIEKICARMTDLLITINREDYERAKKKMPAKRVEYVPGVGIDVKKFAGTVVDKAQKRRELHIPEDAFFVLSVGELNENKNHATVIRAIARLNDPKIHYAIAGRGDCEPQLKKLAEDLQVNLHLLGFRSDVAELYKAADLYIHPSYREGLPVALMEAIASKVPAICSDIRGNTDLVDAAGLFAPRDVVGIAERMETALRGQYHTAEQYYERLQAFDLEKVNGQMLTIYGQAAGK